VDARERQLSTRVRQELQRSQDGQPDIFHVLRRVGLATDTLDRIPEPGILPVRAAALHGRLLAPTRRPAAFGQELSEREVVVLRLLAAGLSQREIAIQLYISPNTVKTHLRATYRKLGAATRAQALDRARDLGVLLADQLPGPARSPG